jgi:hypothetical protein
MAEQIRFPPRIRGASSSTASAGPSANGAAPGGVRRAAAASLGLGAIREFDSFQMEE